MTEYKIGRVKEITSLANPIIKELKSLSQKKNRTRDGLFIAEGLKLIIDGIDLGWAIKTLVFSKAQRGNSRVEQLAAHTVAHQGLVIEAAQKVMANVSHRDNPQSVIGVFKQRYHRLEQLDERKGGVMIALDRIRDPGNLGTIIRTADAAGVRAIFLIDETVDPFSIETVRATMGSIFAVPLYRVTSQEFLHWKKASGVLTVGTHLQGSIDFRTINYQSPAVVVLMGNEQQGLTDLLAESCDILARIPQVGRADSLNLAVATALMVYEARRADLSIKAAKEE